MRGYNKKQKMIAHSKVSCDKLAKIFRGLRPLDPHQGLYSDSTHHATGCRPLDPSSLLDLALSLPYKRSFICDKHFDAKGPILRHFLVPLRQKCRLITNQRHDTMCQKLRQTRV